MSHTVEIKSFINNIDILTKAFNTFGWNIVQNQKARTYPYDPQKDTIYDFVAVNPTGKFDIGILNIDGEYKLFGDFYDHTIAEQLGDELGLLKQNYNINLAKQFLDDEEMEYRVIEAEDGMLEIEVDS